MPSPRNTTAGVLAPVHAIQERIFAIRGQRVMLSAHLAEMYGVEARTLVQAVKRNIERFPPDFMFQLSADEWESLRSHFVIIETGRGKHSKYLPYAFTEQGVAMLSSVLRSQKAIEVNIAIMRTFVRLRYIVNSNSDLAAKLSALEGKYDTQFKVIFDAIRALMDEPRKPKRRIGFRAEGSLAEVASAALR